MTSAASLHALHEQAMGAALPWVGEDVIIDIEKGHHILVGPERAADRVRLIPNTRKIRDGVWRLAGRAEHIPMIQDIFDGHVEVTAEAEAALRSPQPVPWEPPVPIITFEERETYHETGDRYLLEHQAEDVAGVLAAGGNGIFAHDMGLGKTIMAIHWARAVYVPDRNHMLVVSTRAMLYQWQDEIEKHWPGAATSIADGTLKQKRDAVDAALEVKDRPSFVITTYDAVRSLTSLKSWGGKKRTEKQKQPKHFQDRNIYWGATIIDEAHRISNPKNITSMAIGAIGDVSHYRLAMSGTIMKKASDDLWGVLHWTDPELWGSRSWYRSRYADMVMEWHGRMINRGFKAETLAELETLMEPTYFRRHKNDIPGLPTRMPTVYREIPLTDKQAKQYEEMEEMLFSVGDLGVLVAENGLVRNTFLRMIACGLLEIGEDGDVQAMSRPSNKIDAIMDHITELRGEPTVIGVDSRKFADLVGAELTKAKIPHGLLVGGRKTYELQADVRAYQGGDSQVIVAQYGVGSESVTLTRGNDVLLAQENWAWTETDQLISRVHRLGQEEPVRVTVLQSLDTIDHWVREVNVRKMTLAEVVNKDGLDLEDLSRGGLQHRRMEGR